METIFLLQISKRKKVKAFQLSMGMWKSCYCIPCCVLEVGFPLCWSRVLKHALPLLTSHNMILLSELKPGPTNNDEIYRHRCRNVCVCWKNVKFKKNQVDQILITCQMLVKIHRVLTILLWVLPVCDLWVYAWQSRFSNPRDESSDCEFLLLPMSEQS